MTRTAMPAYVRWCGVALALAAMSVIASSWRPDPGARRTLTSTVVSLVPPIFTVGAGQGMPVKVCTKKPVTGEKMIFTLTSSSATTTSNVVHPITTTPSELNFAGLSGPAGVFASNIPLPAANYSSLTLFMSQATTVRGVVTCDVDGAGPIPARTYYTGGNPNVTVPDPFVLNAADANPVDTLVPGAPGADIQFTMPVPFNIVPGTNTAMNLLYDTDEGFGLWDISVITGVPDTYKIVPNDMRILAALPTGS